MSEKFAEFIVKAKEDEALQGKLAAISGDDSKAIAAQVVSVAAEAGFTFSAEEMENAQRAHLQDQHDAGEISTEDLEKISGGNQCDPGVAGQIGTALNSFFTYAFKALGCNADVCK